MSLSGLVGNLLAIFLYASISLLPLWPLAKKSIRPKGSFLRLLLVAMSAYLFFLLYYMVNPSLIQTLFHGALGGSKDMLMIDRAILCIYFYSLLFACWIVMVMSDTDRLTLELKRLIAVLGAAMIISVFYINVADLKSALASLPKAAGDGFNLGSQIPGLPESFPFCDGLIAVLRFVLESAPSILLLTALPMAYRLLNGLEKSFFSEGNQRHAAAVALRCRLAILVSLGGMLAMGALQLLLSRYLSNVNLTGNAPVAVLIVSLAMMLLSRYLERSFAVYRENQMMI
jgi:hypothetical protein